MFGPPPQMIEILPQLYVSGFEKRAHFVQNAKI